MQKSLLEREQKIKEDWVLALDNLTNQIKQWLSEDEHRLIKINKIFIEKFEEHTGNYIAPMLVISNQNAKVEIRPVGRFAIGAIGRVDMANDRRSHTFLFSNKRGWISLENRKPLNKDLFFKYLDDMLQPVA